MEIQFHGHQTEITDSLRVRATEGAQKLAEHLGRPVDADIWFDEDGVLKTVEVVLHAPRYKKLVARGEAKYHEPALTEAIAKLDAQIRKMKSAKKRQVRGVELRA
ncbi:MAG TPA: HPF/RaiA family ribosome-associated protein [Candidatus Elarobacter sp.]|nr:HPF/RaiA family ribosome-associated protein [Candidatus Elarobacter sp.]